MFLYFLCASTPTAYLLIYSSAAPSKAVVLNKHPRRSLYVFNACEGPPPLMHIFPLNRCLSSELFMCLSVYIRQKRQRMEEPGGRPMAVFCTESVKKFSPGSDKIDTPQQIISGSHPNDHPRNPGNNSLDGLCINFFQGQPSVL